MLERNTYKYVKYKESCRCKKLNRKTRKVIKNHSQLVLKRIALTSAGLQDKDSVIDSFEKHVSKNTILSTDQGHFYKHPNEERFRGRVHGTVNHRREYRNGKFYTNGIEGVFGNVKRMISGTHRSVTKGHIDRYLNIRCFLWNTRHLAIYERITELLRNMDGSQISNKEISCNGKSGRMSKEHRAMIRERFNSVCLRDTDSAQINS
jgi:hypothetical protein